MPAGNIADLSFAIQTTKGTAAATAAHRVYLMGGGFGPVREIADVEETSASRLRSTAYLQRVRADGSPQMACRPNFIGLLLYGAMGAKGVTGAGDPYTHTFTLAATQPYLTVWRTLATLYERFTDCKVTSLTFESTAGGVLAVTAGIAGLTPAFKSTANTTATPETVDTFVHADLAGQILVEGVAASRISRVTVTMNTGAEIAYGDRVYGDAIEEGMFDITIATEQTISDFALWNRYHYGTATPADNAAPSPNVIELAASGVDVAWTKRDATGVAAVPARELRFVGTRLQISGISGQDPNTDGSPLTRTVTYKVYQPGTGSGLTATLKNSIATYPAS